MIDIDGKRVADLVVFSEGDHEERLSTAVTLDMGGSLEIPFNIFMNSSILGNGTIRIEEPVSAPGDFIEMRGEMDLIVDLEACSVEESACNAFRYTPLAVQVFR